MADTIQVELGERSYPIIFGHDVLPELALLVGSVRASGRKVAIISDENLMRCQETLLQPVIGDAPCLVVPPGEGSKSLEVFGRALDFLACNRLDRTSVVVALGGGVIGDLAGYAAASYLRGVDFLQIPTTLLAMVDSSVGGKTGINLKAGKNLVGAFHQPRAVFVSTRLLETLPNREFAAGMAEVIKYGLLGDATLFERLERLTLSARHPDLASIVLRCCEIKARIVEADERELAKEGGRALLNLGHTFAHAVEQVAGYGTYLHGEAVAIGLSAAARLSRSLGLLSDADVFRVDAVLKANALPTRLAQPLPYADLQAAMTRDKKVRSGSLRFIVMKGIGNAVTEGSVAPGLAEAAFRAVGAE